MSENPHFTALRDVTFVIKDGTHGTHQRVRDGVPFLSAKNITSDGQVSWDDSDEKISPREFEVIHKTFQLKTDDLLLTIVGTLGRRAIYRGDNVTFQRSVAYIRPDTRKILSPFLFHCMGHNDFLQQLKKRSNATAQAGLYLGELGQVSIPLFSKKDQIKIAEILDTLDAAIRGTEAVVAKLKAMKQGLLHDLLTRGIDANGDLRPPHPEAPHLYKQTPLGWLPKEWDCSTLANAIASIDSGWSPACIETPPPAGEWGVLKVSAVTRGFYDDQQSKTLPSGMKPRPTLEVQDGDVILTRANGVAELVGKTVQVQNTQEKLMLSDKLLRLVPDKD
ncbi:restriction endonuclease subunit S, partial [Rhodovulum sulfidophilum]|uniref:restriction endonuclease subunit S n=1 Tax=Rhodovulum sulfidophilum TaxID=35806 RepID=UPI001924B414